MGYEKWRMFRNYLHNTLGITKDDIRDWIQEAVNEQAKAMVHQTFGAFNPEVVVRNLIFKSKSDRIPLASELLNVVAKELCKNITIAFKADSNETAKNKAE